MVSDAKAVINHSEENMTSNISANSKCGFSVGDTIVHELLGRGKVIDVNDKQYTCTIKFDNLSTERTVKINGRLKKADC